MTLLVIGSVAFVLVHAIPGSGLRPRLVASLGEGPYLGAFSLASAVVLVAMIVGYGQAIAGPPWWVVGQGWLWVNAFLMIVPFVLVIAGGAPGNPAAVRGEAALAEGKVPRGIFTITRHPMMVGIALWAVLHLIANPDGPSWVLFGALLVTAALAFTLQERHKAATVPGWDAYAARSSIVPFAAALAGRTKIDLAGIGLRRIVIGVALWAVVLWAHPWLFGVSPLPM